VLTNEEEQAADSLKHYPTLIEKLTSTYEDEKIF